MAAGVLRLLAHVKRQATLTRSDTVRQREYQQRGATTGATYSAKAALPDLDYSMMGFYSSGISCCPFYLLGLHYLLSTVGVSLTITSHKWITYFFVSLCFVSNVLPIFALSHLQSHLFLISKRDGMWSTHPLKVDSGGRKITRQNMFVAK